MRELYERPRDAARFRAYLELLRGGTGDVAVPVGAFNPMAKPHVLARLDELLAMGAEAAAAEACREAERRLPGLGSWRVALQVPDDVAGGWTDRDQVDGAHRFEGAAEVKRGLATVLLFVSDPAEAGSVRRRTLATLARRMRQRDAADPRTLREMVEQERDALGFAGERAEPLAPAERERFERRLDATVFGTRFAAFFGDEAAERLGYPKLGLPRLAGERFALDPMRLP
jgi:hypothetical protein